MNSELFAEKPRRYSPSAQPSSLRVMEVVNGGGCRRRVSGREAAGTHRSSRARSFLGARALGPGAPALQPIDLGAGLAVRTGERGAWAPSPISVGKITRRFPSEKRLARGTRIWTRAARAPRVASGEVTRRRRRRGRGSRRLPPPASPRPRRKPQGPGAGAARQSEPQGRPSSAALAPGGGGRPFAGGMSPRL